jgi:ABC-type lipoprotein release transport system permease subunit
VAEIATLRALGFSAVTVTLSVLLEGLVLALAGALLGSVSAWEEFMARRSARCRRQLVEA